MATSLSSKYKRLARFTGNVGDFVAPLLLRLILAWEFYSSGAEKLHGKNWFADVQERFLFPFNLLPVEASWWLATWFEIIGGIALAVGLGTRFFSLSLMILTVVAIHAAHWPAEWHTLAELWKGYAITDVGFGNFKLPLLFLIMLVPLLLNGAGKLSLDALIVRALR